jgi:hypothetical protein
MKFLITDRNYIGTPSGYLELEQGESIEDVYSLQRADWVELSDEEIRSLDTQCLYEVDASDTGFTISLISGCKVNWPFGSTFNSRCLGDSYFNGCFYGGTKEDCSDSDKVSLEELNSRFSGYVTKYFSYEVPGWCNTQAVKGVSWEKASEFQGPHIEEAVSIREITSKEYQLILDSY